MTVTELPSISLPANGKAGIREVFKVTVEIRKEMYAYHLEAMTEITRLKVLAGVYGGLAGLIVGAIITIVLTQILT